MEEKVREVEVGGVVLAVALCESTVIVFFSARQQKWRRQLLEKNSEIEQYREELDSLLSAMQVLKQGV